MLFYKTISFKNLFPQAICIRMPGMAQPALYGGADLGQGNLIFRIQCLHLPHLPQETPDVVPPQAAVRRVHPVSQVIDAFRDGQNERFIGMEAEPFPDEKFREAAADVPQSFFVVVEHGDVIDITDLGATAQDLLGKAVKIVQVNIGEELARQVADRDASFSLERGKQVVAGK